MNANELAYELETNINSGLRFTAATMLRQQQAEIEALKSDLVKELNNGGEPVKNATYWKRQYNLMATQNDNLKSGLYHANEQIKYLESHPVKKLTDEEIWEVIDNCFGVHAFNLDYQIALDEAREDAFELVKTILKRACEK